MLYEGVYSEDFQGHYLMVVLGMFIGYAFIALCEAKLDDKEYSLGELSGANAKRAMLVLLIMTMHSFAEGLGVGVSWAGSNGDVKGQFVTAAIGVHNIPEGMTVALMMMPVSKSRARRSQLLPTILSPCAICAFSQVCRSNSALVDSYCAWPLVPARVCAAAWWGVFWAIFSNLPQPVLAVPAYLFVESFRQLLPLGTGAAAGSMIFMVRSYHQDHHPCDDLVAVGLAERLRIDSCAHVSQPKPVQCSRVGAFCFCGPITLFLSGIRGAHPRCAGIAVSLCYRPHCDDISRYDGRAAAGTRECCTLILIKLRKQNFTADSAALGGQRNRAVASW